MGSLFARLPWLKVVTQVVIAIFTTVATIITKKALFTKIEPPPA